MKLTADQLLKHMERIIPEKGSFHVIDRNKLSAGKRAIFVEAHPDDKAMAEGLDVKLARKGIAVVLVTFTDGGARFGLENNESLVKQRKQESIDSAKISEAAMVVNLGYPDGQLNSFEPQAIESFGKIIEGINPEFIITPHEFDEHPDHASAFKITKKTLNGALPLYAMDTITMKTSYGEPIIPTHYFPLSAEEKTIRDDAYRAHTSQVTNIPAHEMKAVDDVIDLPRKRGQKINRPYAGITVKDGDSNVYDPIVEILKEEIEILD